MARVTGSMPERMPEGCQTECPKGCQKLWQFECQNIYQTESLQGCQRTWLLEGQKKCQFERQKECRKICQIYIYIYGAGNDENMSDWMPGRTRSRMPERMSQDVPAIECRYSCLIVYQVYARHFFHGSEDLAGLMPEQHMSDMYTSEQMPVWSGSTCRKHMPEDVFEHMLTRTSEHHPEPFLALYGRW